MLLSLFLRVRKATSVRYTLCLHTSRCICSLLPPFLPLPDPGGVGKGIRLLFFSAIVTQSALFQNATECGAQGLFHHRCRRRRRRCQCYHHQHHHFPGIDRLLPSLCFFSGRGPCVWLASATAVFDQSVYTCVYCFLLIFSFPTFVSRVERSSSSSFSSCCVLFGLFFEGKPPRLLRPFVSLPPYLS